MSHVLAIDTSSGTSVAVLHNGQVLSSIEIADTRSHTESIGDAIANAISDARIKPSQINSVAVGRGPAPFTGLRVGIAAALMFAEGVGAKLFGLISLDAVAKQALDAGAKSPLLVTSDARRSEHYWALYSGLDEHGVPVCIEGPAVNRPADIEQLMIARGEAVATTDLTINAVAIGALFEAQLMSASLSHDITALYLRNPDAVEPKNLRDFGKKVSG
jgi:tRNA threonylcarbamoyl adenosine modification protein YeaZ